MSYRGDIRLGSTLDFKFTTRNFSTGAPFTLAGTPVLAAYVGNGTTEITAGITLTVDFDARVGLNHVRVVASAGNGFSTATEVQIVITAGTVNGVSVGGEVVAEFSIEGRSALMPATAGRTAVVDANGLIDANAVKLGPTGAGTTQTARDLGANIDATISSRSTYAGGAVASVTAGVTVTTNNDKTGYALSGAGVQAIWDALTSALTTVNSIGKKLADWVIGTTQTGDAFARIGAAGAGLTALGDTRLANLDATVSSRSTYAGGAVASVTAGVTVTTNNDKTGYALSGAGVQAIWDTLTSALTTVNSIGKKLADWVIGTTQTGDAFARIGAAGAGLTALGDARLVNLDATVSSRNATAPDNASVTAIKAKTDQLVFTKTNEIDANVQSINGITLTGNGSVTPFNV